MEEALKSLPLERHPRLLVGTETADDAGVYQISEDLALVQTIDFITPIVDDPFSFGQIAAANSLSDVYAMGGIPLTALNLMGFPRKKIALGVMTEILRGGLEKIHEAGAVLLGGHTVDDDELKYGLSVTGTVHPLKILTNKGARPGDVLILTKKIGTGIVSTAAKAEMADPAASKAALESMARPQQGGGAGHGADDRPCLHGHHGLRPHRPCRRNGQRGRPFLPSFLFANSPAAGGQGLCGHGLDPGGRLLQPRPLRQSDLLRPPGSRDGTDPSFRPADLGRAADRPSPAEGERLLQGLHDLGIQEAAVIGEVVSREEKAITVEP